jgi:hypothetical protein
MDMGGDEEDDGGSGEMSSEFKEIIHSPNGEYVEEVKSTESIERQKEWGDDEDFFVDTTEEQTDPAPKAPTTQSPLDTLINTQTQGEVDILKELIQKNTTRTKQDTPRQDRPPQPQQSQQPRQEQPRRQDQRPRDQQKPKQQHNQQQQQKKKGDEGGRQPEKPRQDRPPQPQQPQTQTPTQPQTPPQSQNPMTTKLSPNTPITFDT